MQVQQQLEAQQAQHAAQIQGMSEQQAGLLRQATELDQQHLAQLSARESDLAEMRQVSGLES